MLDTELALREIDAFREKINTALAQLPLPKEPDYLYTPVRYALQGSGKRLRPILVYLSSQAFRADEEEVLSAALAVELLHNFTLVHDDIMDRDERRHNKPTVYCQWDDSTAVLTGDGLFAWAQEFICRVKTNTLPAICAFNKAALMVCEGQAYDKEFEANYTVNMDQYLTMIEKKTGALLALCAQLGGILGDQEDSILQRLYSFGIHLGIAFQIQDDLLEIYGDSQTLGKSQGSDIIAGKQTALTILARRASPMRWQKVLSDSVSKPIEEQLLVLKDYFTEVGVYRQVVDLADNYFTLVDRDLEVFPPPGRDLIKQFTNMVARRNA